MYRLEFLKDYLPIWLCSILDDMNISSITEIRLRRNMPVVIVIDANSFFIDESSVITKYPQKPYIISSKEFDDTYLSMCSYSIYSHNDTIKNGYITLPNGARVGVCGTGVYDEIGLASVKNIVSLNIRIPREIKGCSRPIIDDVFSSDISSIIVAGKPSGGKTTLLRDLARSLSSGELDKSYKVALVDSRNEFAGKREDTLTLDVGINTDVITNIEKSVAIDIALRTLSPDIIICDEISTQKELESISYGFSSGVRFAVSVHACNIDELRRKPISRSLFNTGEFKKLVLIEERYHPVIYDINEVFDENHRTNIIDFDHNPLGNLLFSSTKG